MDSRSTNLETETVHKKQSQNAERLADFETAISATGFGKFNVILLLISVPAAWASAVNTSAISYATPFAGCDFNLTLADKGVLNAVVSGGMVSSAFIWGFFSDAFGRKKLMVGGFLANGFFVVVSGLSQNFILLLVAKFMDGVTSIGAYVIFTSCLSEFHSMVYRPRVVMFFGVLMGSCFVIIPLLGLAILTTTIDISLFGGSIILHNWNIFLLATAIPSIVTGIGIMFLPESPKYLMIMRENDKALEIFKKIYKLNSGRHPDTYPVKELRHAYVTEKEGKENGDDQRSAKAHDLDENVYTIHRGMAKIGMEKASQITKNEEMRLRGTVNLHVRKNFQTFKEGLHQLKSLFLRPYGFVMLQVFVVHFGMFSGCNTLSTWFPQITNTIYDYIGSHHGEDADVCSMLKLIKHSNDAALCSNNSQNTKMFLNTLYPTLFVVFTFCVATVLLKYIGKKQIYFVSGMISGIGAICIYFSLDTNSTTILTTVSWSFSTVCGMTMIVMVVDLFPTTLRAMAVSLVIIAGRFGTMMGNIIFPYLLETSCLAPFLTIGLIIILATVLMTSLPSTAFKPLE